MAHLHHEARPQPQRIRSNPQLQHFPIKLTQSDVEDDRDRWSESDDEFLSESDDERSTLARLYQQPASRYDQVVYGPLEESITKQSAVVSLRRSSSLSSLAEPAPIPPADSYLCAICRGFFYYCKDPDNAAVMHRVVDVFNGASEGCKFCQVIYSGGKLGQDLHHLRAVMEPSNPKYGTRCKIGILQREWGNEIVWWEIPDPRGYLRSSVHFFMELNRPDSRTRAEFSIKLRTPTEQSRTSSKCSLDLASFWLTNCTKSHHLCRDSTFHTGKLPTRLLRIFDRGLLLCRGSEVPEHPIHYSQPQMGWG